MSNIKMVLLSLFIAPLFVSSSALAYNPTEEVCKDPNAANSSVCQQQTNDDPITGPGGILIVVTNFISWLGGALAVILVIVAGFLYVTSAGDPNKIKKAKDIILYVAVGLLVIVVARIIVAFVINRILT